MLAYHPTLCQQGPDGPHPLGSSERLGGQASGVGDETKVAAQQYEVSVTSEFIDKVGLCDSVPHRMMRSL